MAKSTGLTREELTALIHAGKVDTVVMAFPDLFGRLVGKRTTARFFLEHVADHGTENCDYLIACDIENNPVPGFRFASYDQGYGDMVARADWSAVRIVPWVYGTALIICDVFDVETGAFVARSKTGGRISNPPVVVGDLVVFQDDEGRVTALRPR